MTISLGQIHLNLYMLRTVHTKNNIVVKLPNFREQCKILVLIFLNNSIMHVIFDNKIINYSAAK